MLRAGLLNFSKGVIADVLLGRVDVAAYNAGLKRGENIIILKQGGFRIRPGFRLVSECYAEGERLVPFQFSDQQPYALAFGEQYVQPLTGGGVVLEEELVITGISSAVHAIITAAFHGNVAGDQVFLSGIDSPLGDYLNDRVFDVVASIDDNNFSIDFDTSTLPAFSGATGGITRVATPPPPDPPPPTPPPYVPPDPPPVYSGGGFKCVVDDTPIQLEEDGTSIVAARLEPGMEVWTPHELTGEWGKFRVRAVSFSYEEVWTATINGRVLRATPRHRFLIDGEWVMMKLLGAPDGVARVAQISTEAGTYVSDGVVSHNLKPDNFGDEYI